MNRSIGVPSSELGSLSQHTVAFTGHTERSPALVLTDSLSSRVLFSSGIVQRLVEALEGSIELLATFDLVDHVDYRKWPVIGHELTITDMRDLVNARNLGPVDRIRRFVDQKLDGRFGFYPAAVRHSLQHGFSLERMKRGHPNSFLNRSLASPFPNSKRLLAYMTTWMYGETRFVHPGLYAYLKERCSCLILGNLQTYAAQRLVVCAKRIGLPVIGHIGSWDHPVGKGVVYPDCRHYIVQNEYMVNALVEYHHIDCKKITATGWPQLDVCARVRQRGEFDEAIEAFGLDPANPTIMYCGNSESNAPYEVAYLKRLVGWWEDNARDRFNLLIRPHPRYLLKDRWKDAYAWLDDKENIYLQSPSYDDIDGLALLLQHVAVVMTNAGTILLDSIVNDRPVVCVLYDEGAAAGSRYALNSIVGDHYRTLMRSDAFYEAYNFDDSIKALHRALDLPGELKARRDSIAQELVGVVDGRAGERVAKSILSHI